MTKQPKTTAERLGIRGPGHRYAERERKPETFEPVTPRPRTEAEQAAISRGSNDWRPSEKRDMAPPERPTIVPGMKRGRGAPVTVGNLPGPITPRAQTPAMIEARQRAKLVLDRKTHEGFARSRARFEASTPKPSAEVRGRVGVSGTLQGTAPSPKRKRKRRRRTADEVPDLVQEIRGVRSAEDKQRADLAEGFGGALQDHDLADVFGIPDNEEDN